MAFYLRKSLRSGPIRFNFSKGGVGLSGGITGARLGLNKNGAYVHGGRHGLYYRKKIGNKKRSGKNSVLQSIPDQQSHGPQDLFVDTGVTNPGPNFDAVTDITTPYLPGYKTIRVALGIVGFLALIAGGSLYSHLLAAGCFTVLVLMTINKNRAIASLDNLYGAIREQRSVQEFQTIITEKSPWLGKPKKWFIWHAAHSILEARFDDETVITPEDAQKLLYSFDISDKQRYQIKLDYFITSVDQFLADHQLSEEEEKALSAMADELDISPESVQSEWDLIKILSDIRTRANQDLKPVDVAINLKRGEQCFYQGSGKVINQRVLKRFQRNNVQYREVGYDVDMEGQIYVTSTRILITDDGARSYPLRNILDVTLSLEDQTVQLMLDNRKSPLIITSPEPSVLATVIQKLLESQI